MKNIYLALFIASISIHFEFKYGATMMAFSIFIIITQTLLYIYGKHQKTGQTNCQTQKKNDIIRNQPRQYWKNAIATNQTQW